jgi:hypothetical protein
MLRAALRGSIAIVAVAVLALEARAAVLHDHLKCYKMKDATAFGATVDLRPLDSAMFSVESDCTVKVKSRQICFAVDADVTETDATEIDLPGAALSNAFLCYSLRCPEAVLPETLTMSDRFGTRDVAALRTSTLCVPAVIGDPPPTTTTTTTEHGPPRACTNATPPNCDGTCSDADVACIESSGACVCQFYEPFFPCGALEGPPTCHGTCAGSQSCIEVSGACQCGNVYE